LNQTLFGKTCIFCQIASKKHWQQKIANKLQAPKHPPNKRTIAAQELYFLSGLSGAVPEAGQLAALLLFDQLQGRREGDTTLSSANHGITL
jgi:hypothetical protein